MEPRARLLPSVLLLLLPLLASCEVTLLNGQDPAQMTRTPLIGTPRSPARFAPDVYYPDAYYPYTPGYTPYYPMGLIPPHYPPSPAYPDSYYPYYPEDPAGMNYGYYPHYVGENSYYPYYPVSFSPPVQIQPLVCLPGYQAIPTGFEADGRPKIYLCQPIDYGYYPS